MMGGLNLRMSVLSGLNVLGLVAVERLVILAEVLVEEVVEEHLLGPVFPQMLCLRH
jgi:hypothetical protein